MKFLTLLFTLVFAFVFAPAFAEEKPAPAGDEFEKTLIAMIVEAEKLGVLFAGVKDEPTATASMPHIKNALVGLEQARAKGATLPRPANIAELSGKHSARLQAAMVKLTTEATRIKGNAAASTILSDSLTKALKR